LFLNILPCISRFVIKNAVKQTALINAVRHRYDTAKIRHPNYSIRAFAKKAGVSPATLSLLLQGKRKISRKLAKSLSEKLNFDPQERAEVFGAYLPKPRNSQILLLDPEYIQLTMDQFQLIGDWRAFAILNLIQTINFKNDPHWIAERLGLDLKETKETITRLKRLGMIEEKNGKLSRTAAKYRTTDDVANSSLRKSHAQTLELAMRSLENEPVERRDFTWITLTFDPSKMDETKTLIRKFQDDLMLLNETNVQPTEVYRLAVQFFPLTKAASKSESKP
jgi:transcriptional regulator with XRE-family HTH domain